MMENSDKEDWLNAYFEGTLSEAELAKLEVLFEDHPDWKQEWLFRKQLQRAIYGTERRTVKEALQQIEASTPYGGATIRRLSWWRYMAAAAAVLFIASVFWFTTRPAPLDLFSEYYERYPNLAAPIARSEVDLDSIQQAFYWYDGGKYDSAAALLKQLYHRPAGQVYHFYAGMALLEAERWEEADRELASIAWDSGSGDFPQATYWYRALIAVRAKRFDDARVLLLSVQSANGPLTDQAAKLLAALPR